MNEFLSAFWIESHVRIIYFGVLLTALGMLDYSRLAPGPARAHDSEIVWRFDLVAVVAMATVWLSQLFEGGPALLTWVVGPIAVAAVAYVGLSLVRHGIAKYRSPGGDRA